jgi:hypothetical protein
LFELFELFEEFEEFEGFEGGRFIKSRLTAVGSIKKGQSGWTDLLQ